MHGQNIINDNLIKSFNKIHTTLNEIMLKRLYFLQNKMEKKEFSNCMRN